MKVKMHEYAPGDGHVLQRFRCNLASGAGYTFEAGRTYELLDDDAEMLLNVRSRPGVERDTVPFAFSVVKDEEKPVPRPAPPPPPPATPPTIDLTTKDLPKATPRKKAARPRLRRADPSLDGDGS